MERSSVFEGLAQLLKIPVEVIRAYAKPRRRVLLAAKRAKRVPNAKKRSENDLFARWRDAPDEQKGETAKMLFDALQEHAKAVLWTKLGEGNPDLASHIASVGIESLSNFREESRFSTWMHRIILNQANLELRRRVKKRKRYVSDDGQADDDHFEDARASQAFHDLEQRILLERINREVSAQEYGLLEYMIDGMSIADIAARLGVTENAAESRRRRLLEKLRKKFAQGGRKISTYGN